MNEENRSKVTSFFHKAIRDACYQIEHYQVGNEVKYEFTFRDHMIIMGVRGVQALARVNELLASDDIIGQRFSQNTLKREVQSVLAEIIIEGSNVERIEQKLDVTIAKLENNSFSSWTAIIPIVNLDLKIPSTQIGQVSIKICTEDTFNDFKRIIRKNKDIGDDVKRDMTSWPERFYIGQVVAECQVQAVDSEHAYDVANDMIEHALNILRFYSRGTMHNDAYNYRMFIGKIGYIYRSQFRAYRWQNDSGQELAPFKCDFKNTGYFYPYVLDFEVLERINNLHFAKINDILRNQEDSRENFEKLLLRAMDLFGSAMNDSVETSSFLKFIISLEITLVDSHEPEKGLMAERGAIILADEYKARNEIFEEIERLYNLRSEFVHKGINNISDPEISMVSYIAFGVIIRLLPWIGRVRTLSELIDSLNTIKFSGPPFSEKI